VLRIYGTSLLRVEPVVENTTKSGLGFLPVCILTSSRVGVATLLHRNSLVKHEPKSQNRLYPPQRLARVHKTPSLTATTTALSSGSRRLLEAAGPTSLLPASWPLFALCVERSYWRLVSGAVQPTVTAL